MMPLPLRRCGARGFTMIELIVVMTVIGLLLSIAVPRYLDSLDRGRAKILQNDIAQLREAIDHYYGDRGTYPDKLEDLVTYRYLRALPLNPYTDKADWETDPPPNGGKGSVYDVRVPGGAAGGARESSGGAGDASSDGGTAPANAGSSP